MYKIYVKILSMVLITVFGGAFIYIFIYAKSYPIPLFHRMSLDAKMMFIRDMTHKENIDTIIIGSSIGLNNIQGIILEESSINVKHVLNMSAFGMEVTHIEQTWELISLFPNVKRIIYPAQSLDFTGSSIFEKYDFDFIKGYTDLNKESIDFKYSFYAYKNFIQCVERRWVWQEKYMPNNTFAYLGFDRTGSAPLHIYGRDIIKKRWDNPYVTTPNEESYLALERIVKTANKDGMMFYFVIQPYRGPLVKKYKSLHSLLTSFNDKTQKIVLGNGGEFLNLHNKLHLSDDYFADRTHLNDKGSAITAQEIALFINENE